MQMLFSPITDESPLPAKLRLDKGFQPCPAEAGDEHYPNGIFEFNITRLLAFIDARADRFPIESITVADIPDYGSSQLNDDTVRAADLSRPVLLAEISPGLYNLIDGHHRIARARREGVASVPGRKIACPVHVAFLTSTLAYESYVEYWNSKLKALQRERARRAPAANPTVRHGDPSRIAQR
jgi:hypothetical protein